MSLEGIIINTMMTCDTLANIHEQSFGFDLIVSLLKITSDLLDQDLAI